MIKFWRSSTARFITLVFGIELILAAGMTLTLRVLTRAELERDAKSYAARLTQELGPVYLKQGQDDFQKLAALRILFSEGRATVILMVDPKGKPVAGNLQGWPPSAKPGWSEIQLYRSGSGTPEQMGILVTNLPDGSRLLTGQIIENDRRLSKIVDRATGTALIFGLPLALFAAFALCAFMSSIPFVLIENRMGLTQWPTPFGWGIIAYVSLFPSLAAQIFFIRAIELIGASRASLFTNLLPVFGAFLSVLVLGEPFGLYHAVSLLLVVGGIMIAEQVTWSKLTGA